MSSVYENKEATKEEISEPVSEDSEIEPILRKQKISQFESIISELEPMEKNKIKRSEILLENNMNLTSFPLEETMYFISIKNHWALKFLLFCIIYSKPQKKLTLKTTQKCCLLSIYSKSWNTRRRKVNKNSTPAEKNPEVMDPIQPQQEITEKQVTKRQTKKRPVKNNGLSSPEVKRLEQLYLKGPASYGSTKRIHTQSKLPLGKVHSYLETKPSFTKYHSIRLKFPGFKVFVKDINEIWSLDLAHVDKLAKYNRSIKYLLVAVDCLSRYLRVELLKTKYATKTAEIKQPEKVWVDDGKEFLGAFKQLFNKRGIH